MAVGRWKLPSVAVGRGSCLLWRTQIGGGVNRVEDGEGIEAVVH